MSYNSRKEALLNEYKGNLFEFLVSKEIAKEYGFEVDFLKQFDESSFEVLAQQEDFVRNYFSEYLEFLPLCARECVLALQDRLDIQNCKKVVVVGKMQATKASSSKYSEVDLIIIGEKETHCSLKFSKYSSFVNTKSAGIKSFLSKYFIHFTDINMEQSLFNDFWEMKYESFAREMHQSIDLEYTNLFENWVLHKGELLPGELSETHKKILHGFYSDINSKLAEILRGLYQIDTKLFKESLYSLLGFSKENIVQVCLFYKKKGEKFEFNNVQIHELSDLHHLLDQDLVIKENKTNIEIQATGLSLQVRLKPMNTFTQKGYKVNCSAKFS